MSRRDDEDDWQQAGGRNRHGGGGGGGRSGGQQRPGQGGQQRGGGQGGHGSRGGHGGGGGDRYAPHHARLASGSTYPGGGGGGGGGRGGRGGRGGPRTGGSTSSYGGGGYHQQQFQAGGPPPAEPKTVACPDEKNLQRKWVGTRGMAIQLVANYFRVQQTNAKKQMLHCYRVDIHLLSMGGKNGDQETKREVKSRDACREFFWKFVENHQEVFGGGGPQCYYRIIYDDASQLYSSVPLNMVGEGVGARSNNADMEFRVEVDLSNGRKGTALISIRPFEEQPVRAMNLTALNLLIDQLARCPLGALKNSVNCEVDRTFMIDTGSYPPCDLNFAFHMLKGLVARVKQGPNGTVLANYDVVHSAFYKMHVEILHFYAFCMRGRPLDREERLQLSNYGMNTAQRRKMRQLLNGLQLCAIVGNNNHYRFLDICKSNVTAREHRFQQQENGRTTEITVEAYYKKRYDYTIQFPHMPLIQCGSRERPVFIPIECLCISEKWQRLRGKIPENLMPMVNKFTTKSPVYRFDDITTMMGDKGVQVATDPFLANFGIDVGNQFLKIGGRVLAAPKCNFTMDFRSQMGMRAMSVDPREVVFSMVIVDRAIQWDHPDSKQGFNFLVEDCRKRGMRIAQQALVPLEPLQFDTRRSDDNRQLRKDLKERVDRVKASCKNVAVMLLIVVPESDDRFYNATKNICERELGVLSQFMLRKTYLKLKDKGALQNAVTRNIYLKLNAKLGGVNNSISPQQDAIWAKFIDPKAPTLFIGVDVTHPPPGDSEFPSIAAVVGNVDVAGARYAASVRIQRSRNEGIECMEEMVKERIEAFRKENGGKLPAHIMMFRDGVSESQFDFVLNDEFVRLKKACQAMADGRYNPNFTLLIVQKRHSTRFYVTTQDSQSVNGVNNGNVPSGTVVDRYIVSERDSTGRPNREFYLCAHKGMLGTSRPAHYYVLDDDWGLTADELQTCTFALCHLFARAPMAVSIPAPVFWAHLACYRARRHFSAQKDEIDSPAASQSSDGRRGQLFNHEMVRVQKDLREKMYFS